MWILFNYRARFYQLNFQNLPIRVIPNFLKWRFNFNFFYFLVGKCKRDPCKYRHLTETDKYEIEKQTNRPMAKVNNRIIEDRTCCQKTFELKHCRSNDYDDCGCECKRRRLHNHGPEITTRNCDSTDSRKLWVWYLIRGAAYNLRLLILVKIRCNREICSCDLWVSFCNFCKFAECIGDK